MSLAFKNSQHLYAVVDRGAPAPPHRRNIAQLREEKHQELAGKQAIDRASAVLDRLDARRVAYKSQIAELKKRDELAAARIARLEDEALARMDAAKLTAAAGFHVTFTARTAPAALDVLDESVIPPQYFREKLTCAVDKIAIKAALGAGAEIAGVRLTQKVSLLRK